MSKRFVGCLWVALLCFVGIALAEDLVRRRTMGITWGKGVPHLHFSARDLINAEAAKKFDSGLPQRIAVQHFVYGPRPEEPLAAGGHSCKIVYDLWQAVYRVDLEVIGGATTSMAMRTRAEVLERCLVMRDVALGEPANYRGVSVLYVASLIQLNPLSTSTVARIRRWLARPRTDYNVETKSFFGSFVSLFVNDRIGAAERVLRLRSQDVEIPPWR
jgi:hypothetical protein